MMEMILKKRIKGGISMENILKIQKLDIEIRKLRRSVKTSKEQKMLNDCSQVMREGRIFVSQLEKDAQKLIEEFNQTNELYRNLLGKMDIQKKQKIDVSDLEHIDKIVEGTNIITADFAKLEQRVRNLKDKMERTLGDYNKAMQKLRATKNNLNKAKLAVAKLEETNAPKIDALKKQIKEIEPSCNAELLSKYKEMREDNIFPVFVGMEDNRCGGCRMELSLNFVEKLKQKGMLPCEECRRIILYKGNK